jgi:Protein of unknown function (DUF1264)
MAREREPVLRPPGDPKTLWRAALQQGSSLIQDRSPLKGFDVYVAGLHCAKARPDMQMEAHHFCKQVNADFLQCVLFDGNTANANLIGIEYIVSEAAFERVPDAEKRFWHPHNYEVLSGQLVAPGLPRAAEHALMKLLLNSYGKTWHTWHTGRHDRPGEPGEPLPFGEPALMWSFNRDGEADETLKRDFEAALDIDEARNRADRRDLARLAHPQRGVAALEGAFPHPRGRPEGVRDADEDAG